MSARSCCGWGSETLRTLDWKWIWWQVGLPLVMPIAMAFLFALLWGSLSPDFTLRFEVLIDLTPWALATYALALIGSTFRTFWGRLDSERVLGFALLAVAIIDIIYYAFMVIRRHDPGFQVTANAYYVTAFLVVASIILCYGARDGAV